jgi:hypothetical protein
MATARVIPRQEIVQVINIDSTFTASPKAVIIAAGTEVNFTNNSGATINITFEPNPPGPALFVNTPNLAPGTIDGQTPQPANGSVNYYVNVVGGASHGPYAIQVGNGPLYIQVTYNNATGQGICTPDQPVIPYLGYLEMISNDYNYSVSWPTSFGDPFTPLLTSIGIGAPNNTPHKETSNLADYKYTVTKLGATKLGVAAAGGGGGGTIKVKST